MDDLFISDTIVKSISLEPRFINKNIHEVILKKIKENYEGKCIKNGYVKPGSIKIIKRSIGNIIASHFNGNVLFNLELSMEVCNPLNGAVIEAQILNSNKMGHLAGVPYVDDSPLNILLARQHHISKNHDEFNKLNISDIVKIKIIGKRFEYGDNQISIIGILA